MSSLPINQLSTCLSSIRYLFPYLFINLSIINFPYLLSIYHLLTYLLSINISIFLPPIYLRVLSVPTYIDLTLLSPLSPPSSPLLRFGVRIITCAILLQDVVKKHCGENESKEGLKSGTAAPWRAEDIEAGTMASVPSYVLKTRLS